MNLNVFARMEKTNKSTASRFLGHLDENNAVDAFPAMVFLKIARDIADGLQYLHESNVFHRDLKTANVLVSSRHYCDKDNDKILASFNREPIVCKLSDFGESRSEEVQTQLLCSTNTSNVDRGTPSFMAPETRTILEARADDIKLDIRY